MIPHGIKDRSGVADISNFLATLSVPKKRRPNRVSPFQSFGLVFDVSRPISTDLDRSQPISISLNRSQSVSTDLNPFQSISSDLNPSSTDLNPSSTDLNLSSTDLNPFSTDFNLSHIITDFNRCYLQGEIGISIKIRAKSFKLDALF